MEYAQGDCGAAGRGAGVWGARGDGGGVCGGDGVDRALLEEQSQVVRVLGA